jgi:hypothetical protein
MKAEAPDEPDSFPRRSRGNHFAFAPVLKRPERHTKNRTHRPPPQKQVKPLDHPPTFSRRRTEHEAKSAPIGWQTLRTQSHKAPVALPCARSERETRGYAQYPRLHFSLGIAPRRYSRSAARAHRMPLGRFDAGNGSHTTPPQTADAQGEASRGQQFKRPLPFPVQQIATANVRNCALLRQIDETIENSGLSRSGAAVVHV